MGRFDEFFGSGMARGALLALVPAGGEGPLPPATLWALRILASGAADVGEVGPRTRKQILRALGVAAPEPAGDEEEPSLRAAFVQRLEEVGARGVDRRDLVLRNAEHVRRMFRLTPLERDLVAFGAYAALDETFGELVTSENDQPIAGVHAMLAAALDVPVKAVRSALRPDAPLVSSGLVHLGPRRFGGFPLRLPDGVTDALQLEVGMRRAITKAFFRIAARPALRLDDFAHVADLTLVRDVLRAAVSRRRRGVNILVHGAPGTGKTELARALAADARARLYEVLDEDDDGDSMEGYARLRSCAVAQRVLARTARAVLLFDEMEDAFPFAGAPFPGAMLPSSPRKAWTHRLLEENPVPMVWVTNSVAHMDAATLRRFTIGLELRPPPLATRKAILARSVPVPLPERELTRYAADERVTPAHLEKAGAVARLLGTRDRGRVEQIVARVVDLSVRLGGATKPAGTARLDKPTGEYDLRYVNTDVDLGRVVEMVTRTPSATVCLHGPPGTGKTAFVAHVAERLGRRLQVVRASDLLRPFLGETEELIAQMFHRARDEESVLLLDEADSFLRDRADAVRRWEVTQVNELLVQMEDFEGLFFCATNLFEKLDAASLRRFGLKVAFRPMRADQRWALFLAMTGPLEENDAARLERDLASLSELTPGDFAAAARRLTLTGESGPEALAAALREEHALKTGTTTRAIGFGRHAR